MIDGGTEAFKGNARVVIPGITACIECTLDLFPPQVNYPMCTIASTPRLPEHCIEYAKVFQWPEQKPYGDAVGVDGDNPDHVQWIFDKALKRSQEYNIKGVTYRLTQGVIKRIIPAVASTNAVIAASCALEVFKLATNCCNPLNNYMVFNDSDGLYTYTFEAEKKDDCSACGRIPQKLTFSHEDTLQTLLDYLVENQMYQMKAPGITTSINGKNKTLYMQSVPSIEKMTRPNLEKKLKELGITEGHEIAVADSTSPKPIVFRIYYETKMDEKMV